MIRLIQIRTENAELHAENASLRMKVERLEDVVATYLANARDRLCHLDAEIFGAGS